MCGKRISTKPEDMAKRKKYKAGSQKRLFYSKKELFAAGSAPGQLKLCLQKRNQVETEEARSRNRVAALCDQGTHCLTDSNMPLTAKPLILNAKTAESSGPFLHMPYTSEEKLETESLTTPQDMSSSSSETVISADVSDSNTVPVQSVMFNGSSCTQIECDSDAESCQDVLSTFAESVTPWTDMPLPSQSLESVESVMLSNGTSCTQIECDSDAISCQDVLSTSAESVTPWTDMPLPSQSLESVSLSDMLSVSADSLPSCSDSTTSCNGNSFMAPDPLSSVTSKLHFLKAHPIQPLSDANHVLPFQEHKIYFRPVPGASAITRKWLSFCMETQEFFCSTCMAFGTNRRSQFVTGWKVVKLHIHERIREHEESVQHLASANAYLSAVNRSDIESLINVNLVNKKKEKVLQNRAIVTRVIDIILCIAKLGLAYRGKDEAAHNLKHHDLNHGNFLELVLLLGKYDCSLQKHIEEVVALSSKRKAQNPMSRGRGGLVTLLSKTSVNHLILIMGKMVKQEISQDVKKAVKFSVEMDSTQDVSVKEQCSIILRYVKDRTVQERLFSLINVTSTTGERLFHCLKEQLEHFNLSANNIIGCSFDGAANLSGSYNGVQAHLKTMSCNCVYTWCYSHVLNLVITEITQCVTPVKSFFGLLEKTSVFFSESYKRSHVWSEQVCSQGKGQEKLVRLKKISDTRWWSKPRALRTIFGSTVDQSKELYSTLLYCLHFISESTRFDGKAVSESKNLLHAWTRYETLLISFLFMQIFEIASPVSDYLQTRGLDILQAWRMVEIAKDQILKLRDSFPKITTLVDCFVRKASSTLQEHSVDIVIESQLPQRRLAKKKKMPGELAEDELLTNPLQRFHTQVFYVVIDRATTHLEKKFSKNETLIRDISYLDPKRFSHLSQCDIPTEALKTVADLADVDIAQLKVELLSFIENYRVLKKPCPPPNRDENDAVENEDLNSVKLTACENCLTCCYRILYDHNLQSASYTNLFAVYKVLLTLACTQVSCERVFSKLKIVKTRLRSLIGQDLLESFILLNIERDISSNLKYDDIIDKFANSSSVLKNILS